MGCSIYEIADKLGVSPTVASRDTAAVRKIWQDSLSEQMDVIRADAVARYEWLLGEAIEGWNASKRQGQASDKLLNAATNILRERNKILGLGLDLTAIQQNVQINGEATVQQVSEVFAPLDAKDYAAFIEEKGPMTSLPPIPGKDDEEAIHEPGTAIQDAPEPDSNSWGGHS